jgi:hypothetical protein
MHTCPLRRAWIGEGSTKTATRRGMRDAKSAPPTHRASRTERWLRVVISLTSLIGWQALASLLAAIPDSNDDFGLF